MSKTGPTAYIIRSAKIVTYATTGSLILMKGFKKKKSKQLYFQGPVNIFFENYIKFVCFLLNQKDIVVKNGKALYLFGSFILSILQFSYIFTQKVVVV